DQSHQPVTLPVAVAEAGLAGVPAPAAAGSVPSACRSDLLHVDGQAVSVRVTGAASAARDGLSLEPCGGPATLTKGRHTLVSRPGRGGGGALGGPVRPPPRRRPGGVGAGDGRRLGGS